MSTLKNLVQEQLCPAPVGPAAAKKWSTYIAAELALLEAHRVAASKLMLDLVDAQAELLQRHLGHQSETIPGWVCGRFNQTVVPVVGAGTGVGAGTTVETVGLWGRVASELGLTALWRGLVTQVYDWFPMAVVVIFLTGVCYINLYKLITRPRPVVSPRPAANLDQSAASTYPGALDLVEFRRRARFGTPLNTRTISAQRPVTIVANIITLLTQYTTPLIGPTRQEQLLHAALAALLTLIDNTTTGGRSGGRSSGGRSREGATDLTVYAGCVVCCSVVADTVLMPCGHLVVCAGCSGRLQALRDVKCPLCRGVVRNTIKVFRG